MLQRAMNSGAGDAAQPPAPTGVAGVARPWEAVQGEAQGDAKRARLDEAALGGAAVLQQHAQQQQLDQQQRQLALQAHAQQVAAAAALASEGDVQAAGATPQQPSVGLEPPATAQPAPQQLQPANPAPDTAAAPAAADAGVTAAPAAEVPTEVFICQICNKGGEQFFCQGGCGLHAHAECMGEQAIFSFEAGELCGNCYVMQQDRNLKEDLSKGDAARLSVRRAILWINLETNNPLNFEKFGHLASLRLWEVGQVAGYPVKPFAEKYVEPYLQRWIREKLISIDRWQLNVREVFTLMIGLYSLKCACISHDWLDRAINLVKARNLTVTDYIGWHPAIESPNVRCSSICPICGIRNAPELEQCSRCRRRLAFPSVYMKYVSGLLAAYYADRVGIPLGATVMDVFAHTNTVRQAYKGLAPNDPDGLPWEVFSDQLRMIFGLLDIVSDFGSLQLNPDMFGPEVAILFNATYVHRAIVMTDFEIIGRTLQCMKLFGVPRLDAQRALIAACEQFLLLRQMPNGSWCKIGGSEVDQYKATVACSKALVAPRFRGYGPLSSECQRLLEKWANIAKNAGGKPQAKADGTESEKLLACGAVVKLGTRSKFKRLEALYKRQLIPHKGANTMEHLVSARMRALASSKTAAKTDVDEEDDEVTNVEDGKAEAFEDKSEGKPEAESETKQETKDSIVSHDDARESKHADDELTHMSLSEDLEIFDGLKFEDGDVIDLTNTAALSTNVDDDDGDGDENVEADGAQGNGDEEDIGDDDMYDDDNEDDGSGSNGSGEDPGQPTSTVVDDGEQAASEPVDDVTAVHL